MKNTKIILLAAIVMFGCLFGCNSEYEQTMDRQKKMSGEWEKDLEMYKNAQKKPGKMLYEREYKK